MSWMLIALSMVGCVPEDPTTVTEPTPDPEPETLPECLVMIEVALDGKGMLNVSDPEQPVEVTAHIHNVSGLALTFTVADPCPDGLVSFMGLPEGYDFYGSCQAGACATYGDPVTYTLAPEEVLEVTTEVTPGGDVCNPALPADSYTVSARLPLVDEEEVMVCAMPARLIVP